MRAECRKEVLNVCTALIPSGDSMHREGVAQIMKAWLIARILARDAGMFS
jgi:hypothetical protein